MGDKDKVKALRNENEQVKRQLEELKKEFESIKSKMAEQRDSCTATVIPPDTQDVQFLSDSYDALVQSKTSIEEDLGRFSLRLDLLEKNVDRIDKAIDDMLHYSYQYNLKIVGVPLVNENESSEDTANLCLKLFSALGNDISVFDIDIAHRVPQHNAAIDNGRRRQPNAIVCKFTRRMARDKVLASGRNTSQLTLEALGFSPTAEINRIRIYSHLTPRLQELLYAAKAHQNMHSYKWCWSKGVAIFLRKTDTSTAIGLESLGDLSKLRERESRSDQMDPAS